MKYFIKGKNELELSSREFLAQGGEGQIYAKGGSAFKIYLDPSKMIPLKKIQELGTLSLPNIIKPEDVILNSKNDPVGYSMKHLTKTYALCQMFTKAFKDRNNVSNDIVIKLMQNMQSTISHIHDKNILIVDLNEMNFLLNDDLKDIYFIDTDSYQTPSFPATAIMESIRDRHCKGKWSKETDWFSFGIISFQMFTGIHPYKGKHPKLNGFDERMNANISVFNKDVTIPKICSSFSVIPQNYLDWYKSVFEGGKRLPPPKDLIAVVVINDKITKINGTNSFDINEVISFKDKIDYYLSVNGTKIIITNSVININGINKNINYNLPVKAFYGTNTKFGITPKKNDLISAQIVNNKLVLKNISSGLDIKCCDFNADETMEYNGTLYFKSGGNLFQINWLENNKLIPEFKSVANIHENSSISQPGVIMQNLLGKHFATIIPKPGMSLTINLKEIEGTIVDAKFDNNVLMVITSKNAKTGNYIDIEYIKYVFRFSSDYSSYDIRTHLSKEYSPINFVTLDRGVVCSLNGNNEIVLFLNKKDDKLFTVINDPDIEEDIKLYKDGNQVLFTKDQTLYSIKKK